MHRLAENRIHNAAGGALGIPIERERRPFRHHARASRRGNDERNDEHDQAQDALARQFQWLPADENYATAQQIGLVRAPQRKKPSVQDKKCASEKCRKDRPLKAQCLPENVSVPERPEPQGVDVIRYRRPAAENEDGN